MTTGEVLDTVLAGAVSADGLAPTPAQLRRRVRRAVIKADPLAAELAAERACAARQVTKRVEPDSQASLMLTGPAIAIATIWTALDLRASRPSSADDRTLDARRFDALVDICREAGGPSPRRPAPRRVPVRRCPHLGRAGR